MNIRVILLLALFPFLHATSYPVSYVSCKSEEIIVKKDDQQVEVALFNLKITDKKGWIMVEDMISKAKKLRIEIDPTSKITEPIPVYLFADEKLVQEEVIRSGYGYPMIHNPEYTYEERLEAAFDSTQTMAKPAPIKETKSMAVVAPIYFGVLFVIWGSMGCWIWVGRKKKISSKVKKEL